MKFFTRNDHILKLARGRNVLHVGCVGFADLPTEQRVALARRSLHYLLSKEANTIGVDYSRAAIQYFREKGLFDNVYFGDAQDLANSDVPARIFDVVVAGDIIEHLSCPGLFLEGLSQFMSRDSLLVVTTPNAFGLFNFIRYFRGQFREGLEHVASYNNQNLTQLLDRHGFSVVNIDTCHQEHARTAGLAFHIGKRVLSAMPRLGGTLFVTARLNQ
jgi:2-polyprenyl-3-methyl-5-hydroxy-6-metoxy-1,4-benzoquinol methylase